MPSERNGPGAPASAAEAKGNNSDRSFSLNFSREQAAAHAVAWGDKLVPRRTMLRGFRPLVKGALRGFVTVELPCGLVLHDVAIFAGRNGPWASRPSKPVLNQDGRHRSDINGKPQYAAVAEWRSRELARQVSVVAVDLMRAAPRCARRDGGIESAMILLDGASPLARVPP